MGGTTDILANMDMDQVPLANRAGDSDPLRKALAARCAWANVKPMAHRVDNPVVQPLYRVERFFNKLKDFGPAATRYGKHAENISASSKLP